MKEIWAKTYQSYNKIRITSISNNNAKINIEKTIWRYCNRATKQSL